MQTTTMKPEARPAPQKAANAKPPDIASTSVPDTLAALKVNPETGLTAAEVDIHCKEWHRAAGVVEALRRRLQVSARVRRDSSWQVIAARELVPGDILRVRPGTIIPADIKLLFGALSVDQSALTGESKGADKAPRDVLSSGSVVRRGEGNGVVILTGAKTYFGRTTELVQEASFALLTGAGF